MKRFFSIPFLILVVLANFALLPADAQNSIDVQNQLSTGVDPIILPTGTYTLSGLPQNPLGSDLMGPGAIMVPVDPQSPDKGNYRYTFPENDRYQRTFGEEYLYALHMKWREQNAQAPPTIYLDGDSTIHGDYIQDPSYLPQNILLSQLQRLGLDATIVNKSVSGTVIGNFHLSDDDIKAADCIIISYGINDTEPIDQFIQTYRSKLEHIRSLRTYMQTTVVIKTSNAVGDTTHHRDETQAWLQRKALRQAARDYQCFYFDTAGYIADPRNGASGTWNDSANSSTPITPGWMDDAFRTDPHYRSELSFGNTVHPLEIADAWIWGRIADALAPPGVRRYAFNTFENISPRLPNSGTDAPATYSYGLTLNQANSQAGWPADGMVMGVRSASGFFTQYLTAQQGNASTLLIRTSKGDHNDTWGDWTSVGGVSSPSSIPALENSWKGDDEDDSFRLIKQGECVHIQGSLSSGTLVAGTELFVLPEGYRPSKGHITLVCAGGTNRDELVVLLLSGDGQVTIQKPPTTAHIFLDSISFATNQAFKSTARQQDSQ